MSYRRSWMLVDTMNRCWNEIVVETHPGSTRGGGARLTEFGRTLLANYRALHQRVTEAAVGPEMDGLAAAVRQSPSD